MLKKYIKKVNKKDLITLVILVLLSVFSIIFVNNNDSLYKTEILKITNIKTIKVEVEQNDLGLKEKHYQRKITGIICNTKNKSKKKTIEYEETYSKIATEKYQVGDKVFVKDKSIEGLKRDKYVVFLLVIFVIVIYLVGNTKGVLAVLSVTINTIIFYFSLNLYFKGFNLIVLSLIESIFFTIISLIIAGGLNKKTYSAIISVFVSTFILFLGTIIISKTTDFSGISFNDLSFITVPVEDVFLAELIIGGLGAIMDVAITMSSSIEELIEKDSSISLSNLNKSGKQIGSDIMSTMISVLFFTYLCSGLPLFVLAIRNGFTIKNYITSNFSLEATRFLIGSIGIVLSIPISKYIAIKIFKRGDK